MFNESHLFLNFRFEIFVLLDNKNGSLMCHTISFLSTQSHLIKFHIVHIFYYILKNYFHHPIIVKKIEKNNCRRRRARWMFQLMLITLLNMLLAKMRLSKIILCCLRTNKRIYNYWPIIYVNLKAFYHYKFNISPIKTFGDNNMSLEFKYLCPIIHVHILA